jgi:hypothetical protein
MMPNGKKEGQDGQYLRAVFDASPLPTFVVDADIRIHDYNAAAAHLVGPEPELALHRRGGDALHCIHAEAKGCGQSEQCQDCVIRNSLKQTLESGKMHRQIHKAELRSRNETKVIDLLVTAAPLPGSEPPRLLLMLENVSELLTLRGLMPICARCKKVRDDQQCWQSIETYLLTQMNVHLTHGLCPTCLNEQLRAFEADLHVTESQPDGFPG